MRVLGRLLHKSWKWCDSAQGTNVIILEAALSEKNEKAWLPLLINFGDAEVLLYPCLRYCKGVCIYYSAGSGSQNVCGASLVWVCSAWLTERRGYRRGSTRSWPGTAGCRTGQPGRCCATANETTISHMTSLSLHTGLLTTHHNIEGRVPAPLPRIAWTVICNGASAI